MTPKKRRWVAWFGFYPDGLAEYLPDKQCRDWFAADHPGFEILGCEIIEIKRIAPKSRGK